MGKAFRIQSTASMFTVLLGVDSLTDDLSVAAMSFSAASEAVYGPPYESSPPVLHPPREQVIFEAQYYIYTVKYMELRTLTFWLNLDSSPRALPNLHITSL
ncbi:hypothetical protein BDW68DRAFT_60772 [Aspergillus falconensis]